MGNALLYIEMSKAKATRASGGIYKSTCSGRNKATLLEKELVGFCRDGLAFLDGEVGEREDVGNRRIEDSKVA